MWKKLIFAVRLLGVAIATPRQLPLDEGAAIALHKTIAVFDSLNDTERLASVNDIVDLVMTEMCLLMGDLGFDPLQLPDVHKNFSYKPIIIIYHGELDLDKGWAQDVSEFFRNGDCILDYSNRKLRIEVPFKFKQILFNYDYNIKLMGLGPNGGVEGTAENIEVYFCLLIDFETLLVTLDKFEIEKIGKITCKVTGNGIIDWIVNLVSALCIPIFKGLITWIVENIAFGVLIDIIDFVNSILGKLPPPPEYGSFVAGVPGQI